MNNSPIIVLQLVGANGPLAGSKLYSYAAGSTNPKLIYFDKDLTIPCPSPLISDASGIFAQFFLESGEYKFQMYDANDVLIATRDYISTAGDGGSTPIELDYKLKVINEDTVPHFLEYKIVPQSDSITQTVVNNVTFGKQVSLSVREDWLTTKIRQVVPNIAESFPEPQGSFGGIINKNRLYAYDVATARSVTFMKLFHNTELADLASITTIISGSSGSYGLCVYDTDQTEPLLSTAQLKWSTHINGHTSADPYDYVTTSVGVTLREWVWVGVTFYYPLSGIGSYSNEGIFLNYQNLTSLLSYPGSSVISTMGSYFKFNLCTINPVGPVVTYDANFSPFKNVPFNYYFKLDWN